MSTRIICRLLVMCGLVAGLSMSGSVAQATCSFCDLSDGSCCDGQYAGCNCLEICGPGSKLPCGTTCAGYHGVDCRLRTGECVTGWDEACCIAAHGKVTPCALAAKDAKEPVPMVTVSDDVCEGDDSDLTKHGADEDTDATPPGKEDAFCFCPGGRCCGGTCYPGAHCCIAGVGYECCDDDNCTPPDECVWRHCTGGAQ